MQSNEEDRCVHGTCIWFSDEKGYGFLLSDDGVSSMVHYTDIKNRDSRDFTEVKESPMKNWKQREEDRPVE